MLNRRCALKSDFNFSFLCSENKKIHRGVKPVWWSPATQTALAEAELVYEEKHVSQSVFVAFPVHSCVALEGPHALVAWTTTPWTLPANKALIVSKDLSYSIVEVETGARLVVASELLEKFVDVLGSAYVRTNEKVVLGSELIGGLCEHPFLSNVVVPVLGGDFVTTDVGTGVVHAAPGHGQDDYLVCGQAGIGPFSPVDGKEKKKREKQENNLIESKKKNVLLRIVLLENGKFTADVGVESLVGLEVLGEGTKHVIELLKKSRNLISHQK
jgi:isoleucyl-tRNA synthetase